MENIVSKAIRFFAYAFAALAFVYTIAPDPFPILVDDVAIDLLAAGLVVLTNKGAALAN